PGNASPPRVAGSAREPADGPGRGVRPGTPGKGDGTRAPARGTADLGSVSPDRRGWVGGGGGRPTAADARRFCLQGQKPGAKAAAGSHCRSGGTPSMNPPCPANSQLEQLLTDPMDATVE